MQRFQPPGSPLAKSLVDPGQRDYAAWNVYPTNRLEEWEEGFYFQEGWGAQYRGQFLIPPTPLSVSAGSTSNQTITWTYAKPIPLGSGYVLLYNGTSVSTNWTAAWTVTVDGAEYPIQLTDIGTITVPAASGSRLVVGAPALAQGTVTWTIVLSGSTSTTADLWAGLMAW